MEFLQCGDSEIGEGARIRDVRVVGSSMCVEVQVLDRLEETKKFLLPFPSEVTFSSSCNGIKPVTLVKHFDGPHAIHDTSSRHQCRVSSSLKSAVNSVNKNTFKQDCKSRWRRVSANSAAA